MYTNVSSEFIEANSKITKNYECRITIGNVVLTNDDVINISFNSMLKNDNAFSAGNCISSSCTLTFITPDSEININNHVKIEFGLLLSDGSYEYVPYGVYNIAKESESDTTTTYLMYDNIIKLDVEYVDEDDLTTYDKLLRIQQQTGIAINQYVFDLVATDSTQSKIEGYSCREVLGHMACLVLGDICCDREGKITIKTFEYDETPNYSHIVTADDYKELSVEKDIFRVKTLRVVWPNGNILEESINKTGRLVEINSPLFSEKMNANGNAYWGDDMIIRIADLEFKGFSMNFSGDILFDLGDDIQITNRKGERFDSYIHNMTIEYNGTFNMIIGASGETDITNSTNTKTDEEAEIERINGELDSLEDVKNGIFENISTSKLELRGKEFNSIANTINGSSQSVMYLGDTMIIYGRTTFTGLITDITATSTITFRNNLAFISPPVIIATVNSSVPQRCSVGVGSITTTGCNIYLNRTNSTDTNIFWCAIGKRS